MTNQNARGRNRWELRARASIHACTPSANFSRRLWIEWVFFVIAYAWRRMTDLHAHFRFLREEHRLTATHISNTANSARALTGVLMATEPLVLAEL